MFKFLAAAPLLPILTSPPVVTDPKFPFPFESITVLPETLNPVVAVTTVADVGPVDVTAANVGRLAVVNPATAA